MKPTTEAAFSGKLKKSRSLLNYCAKEQRGKTILLQIKQRSPQAALKAKNSSRLIPPLDHGCQVGNDCPYCCQRECIIHLLDILSLWLTCTFTGAQEHLCCVIITESSYLCAVLRGQAANDWRSNSRNYADFTLSRLQSCHLQWCSPPFFLFFIANPTQIDACCVRLCLHLNLQTCTGGQVLQPTWRLSRLRSHFLCSLLRLGVVLQSSP